MYDVEVDPGVKIYKNNSNQAEAIRTSLQKPFTLIQGPPGTGKTVTGIKLVYWFVHMNKKTSGVSHPQVLYCGPSNSSVDVAAKWLMKLGKNCPKIVRVYSEVLENQIFPIPRDSMQGGSMKGRRYELIDKDENKDIALHHIIRQDGKKFAKKIKAFDRRFEENRDTPEEITDEEVESYQKLITDAAVHELKSFDVILCTCAASASPRMVRGANIRQLIIDECGMCMEPECFVPLVCFKAIKQVVLIGDHKQLQPIVCNSIAKDLGLHKSLFERYHERAFMLIDQYRMHPRICEFPSDQFYDGKLRTALEHNCNGVSWMEFFFDCMKVVPYRRRKLREHWRGVWPKKDFPMVFCHAEGAEKTLSVSTQEGNEASKSNELEQKEAARIFFHMVNFLGVEPDKISILSQYKAQCSEIDHSLKFLGFEHPNVGTVVASQGDEWDFVILSLVRSMPKYEIERKPSVGWCKKNMGFITDEHQINVALTRARLGLIIIGNKHLLNCNPMWKNLLNHFGKNRCIMNVKDFMPSSNRSYQEHRDMKIDTEGRSEQLVDRNPSSNRFNQPYSTPANFNHRS